MAGKIIAIVLAVVLFVGVILFAGERLSDILDDLNVLK